MLLRLSSQYSSFLTVSERDIVESCHLAYVTPDVLSTLTTPTPFKNFSCKIPGRLFWRC